MRRVCVLGSTGTIGSYTLELVRAFPQKFSVASLSAGRNVDKLIAQIEEFQPSVVSVAEERDVEKIRARYPGLEIGVGEEGLARCIDRAEVDVVIVGIVGFAGLAPTLLAVQKGKTVGLANKESLVTAGNLLQREMTKGGGNYVPVDSEHNAIFQLLQGIQRTEVASLVLTASGGPLLRTPELPLADVTPAFATNHPNWKMGPKISVDSATLMNKGLELIEAHFLFQMPEPQIEVWVHPQSIVHGAVWLKDNSCLAQLSVPDMKGSIGLALSYPERLPAPMRKLTFADMAKLEFYEPDTRRFACLRLAREALRAGQSHIIALNAANEIAVEAFIAGRILFSAIPQVVEKVLENHSGQAVESLSDVFALNELAREAASRLIPEFSLAGR